MGKTRTAFRTNTDVELATQLGRDLTTQAGGTPPAFTEDALWRYSSTGVWERVTDHTLRHRRRLPHLGNAQVWPPVHVHTARAPRPTKQTDRAGRVTGGSSAWPIRVAGGLAAVVLLLDLRDAERREQARNGQRQHDDHGGLRGLPAPPHTDTQ